jgi:hypothetical protein
MAGSGVGKRSHQRERKRGCRWRGETFSRYQEGKKLETVSQSLAIRATSCRVSAYAGIQVDDLEETKKRRAGGCLPSLRLLL